MVALSPDSASLRSRLAVFGRVWGAMRSLGATLVPRGLYARALIIMIAPIALLEGVVAFVFMERHWETMTRRLSEATARDIAAIIELYKTHNLDDDNASLVEITQEKLKLSLQVLPAGDLPAARPKPFFDILDRTLSTELRRAITQPFWVDTVGQSRHVEVRVKLDDAVLRFVATRSQTYASNSHIFLLWMVGSSVVLMSIAILFLRNQIRPVIKLAEAAEAFGKGRALPLEFRPRGAREVRQAAQAFIEMRDRISTHVEQRTTMLAGVSHDLKTVLTRFKLQLAMLEGPREVEGLKGDVREMQQMLDAYLAFARGDGGEQATPTNVRELLQEVVEENEHLGTPIEVKILRRHRNLVVPLKRQAFKRALTNLVTNASRYGERIIVRAAKQREWLWIEVDDDGPGIPPAEREKVFRPFYRIDPARSNNEGNSGLGLAIARDIAKSHGGDISLGESSIGGLRAVMTVPL